MARIIRARAPVRVDLAGGWTDVSPWSVDYGGEVVNFAINRYIHSTFEESDDDKISVSYSSEVSNSSGLGTSAALNVAFLAAISGKGRSKSEIAELAFQFETLLGNRGGRQDQWAASQGGFQRLFFSGEKVESMPLDPPSSLKRWLRKHLVLMNTGGSRVSGDLQNMIWEIYSAGDSNVIEALMRIRKAARAMAEAIQRDQRIKVAEVLMEVSDAVEQMAPELNAPYRPLVDQLKADGTITAWKGMGAAGGGHVVLLAAQNRETDVIKAAEEVGWVWIDWDYDDEGLVID